LISDREFTRRLLQTIVTIAVTIIIAFALWRARAALMLVYISALMAMGFSPIVHFIEQARSDHRRRPPRWAAILCVYVVLVGALLLVCLLVLPPLVAQAMALWVRAPAQFDQAQHWLLRHHMMTRQITFEQAVANAPTGASTNAVGTVLIAISSVAGGVFGLITVLILSFYLLIGAQAMFEYLIRFVPANRRGEAATAARQAVVKVSAWLQAQLVLAGTMGLFATAGLWWMGVPYFYVLGLVAAVGETIPVVGPMIGGITAIGMALAVSTKLALMCGAYFFVLHQLEANILVPKIMERRVGVSPVAVIIALLVGADLYGLIGAILAIPTAAILSIIVEDIAAAHEQVRIQRVR
jgi:predicted PurR-regulated permease PerM